MPETTRLCLSLSPHIACRVKVFSRLTGSDFGAILLVAFQEYRDTGKVPAWNPKGHREVGHYRVLKALSDDVKASVGHLGEHVNHVVEAALDGFLESESSLRSEKSNPTVDDRLGDQATADERQFLTLIRRSRASGLSYIRMRQIIQWERVHHFRSMIKS